MWRFSDINITLLLPASLVFIAVILHSYLYRGARLTFVFFGSAFLHILLKELTHLYVENKFILTLRPYRVLGDTPQILQLPVFVYIGWAVTFYLSWYLAERILKRIGYFYDRVFPTISWSILIAGAISYCVEATAIKAGWWLWSFPDPRLKEFIITPLSAFYAWPSQTSFFLLIFFIFECSRFRKQWWRVFLFTFIARLAHAALIIYGVVNFGQKNAIITTCDSVSILLPFLLMFFSSLRLQLTLNLKKNTIYYNVLPLFALTSILFICVAMDISILKKPEMLVSVLPLVLLILLSLRNISMTAITILTVFSVISGSQKMYILCIPVVMFLLFLSYREKYNLKPE